MSYCLDPNCSQPENPDDAKYCHTCGGELKLKDRYRTLKPLGQGGFGKTFLAIDEDKPSQPYCVIKQFFPLATGKSAIAKAAELFQREAIQLDELGIHPQIPDLLAYFSLRDRQYLVQEFIAGDHLGGELGKLGIFDEIKVRALLENLLPVLAFVHEHQVIHRDIKPENIIRRQSDHLLFLVDFGASKIINAKTLQETGTAIGSAGFVAPEQAIGRATYASDIYSLGVTCISLLTGLHPFDLFDIHEGIWIWKKYLKHPIRADLRQILDKMLMAAMSQRYGSISEILQDLQTISTAIDLELEQLQTQFTGVSSQKAIAPPTVTSQSQIDRELEELQSEYWGENKTSS
ncbi:MULTISPECIES: serine/threonine-protein kinase [Spirulina sp. CCY15215]|uniref:serine/threonine-protein kinase n=1 Tax=Spirulina sp. CCY15215 TaxID=2767591 RepID=UPI0019510A15|nr:serine/threonine-protein kinase [Spirulina major]